MKTLAIVVFSLIFTFPAFAATYKYNGYIFAYQYEDSEGNTEVQDGIDLQRISQYDTCPVRISSKKSRGKISWYFKYDQGPRIRCTMKGHTLNCPSKVYNIEWVEDTDFDGVLDSTMQCLSQDYYRIIPKTKSARIWVFQQVICETGEKWNNSYSGNLKRR